MKPLRRVAVVCGTIATMLMLSADLFAEGGGTSNNHTREYQFSNKNLSISIEVDDVAFQMTTWNGSYRLLTARVYNYDNTAIVLSSANDTLHAQIDGASVPAILRPVKQLTNEWSKLSEELRDAVAYPIQLRPDSMTYIYCIFPADKLTTLPKTFTWHIDSTKADLSIALPPPRPPKAD